MGMFDYVTYEAPCPCCGEPIKEWQSKDGDCFMEKYTPMGLLKETDRRSIVFYTFCRGCEAWVEILMRPKAENLPRSNRTLESEQ